MELNYDSQIIPDNVNMKEMVEQVLEETGNKENRAAKMDIDDILKYALPEYNGQYLLTILKVAICLPRYWSTLCIGARTGQRRSINLFPLAFLAIPVVHYRCWSFVERRYR